MTGRLSACALGLMLAACQPLPHPLADDMAAPPLPVLALKDMASVAVEPVSGVPQRTGEALASMMADQLQQANILGTTKGRNRQSYSLIGAAQSGGGAGTKIAWYLLDADGNVVGETASSVALVPNALTADNQAVLKSLVTSAAPALAQLLEDEAPKPDAGAAAPPDLHQVAIRPVTGAPGDGGKALASALEATLAQAQIAVVPSDSDKKPLAVVGTVSVAPAKNGRQQVKISWALIEPDGKQLGVVNQENAVPVGSLDGAWGEVAMAVAEAATPGILTLIDQAGGKS